MATKNNSTKSDVQHDVLLEKINGVYNTMAIYFKQNEVVSRNIESKLDGIHDKVTELDVKVGIQNGRIGKVEKTIERDTEKLTKIRDFQKTCPIMVVDTDLKEFKKQMRMWHIISTNWKMLLIFILGVSLLINIIQPLYVWIWDKVGTILEIGL